MQQSQALPAQLQQELESRLAADATGAYLGLQPSLLRDYSVIDDAPATTSNHVAHLCHTVATHVRSLLCNTLHDYPAYLQNLQQLVRPRNQTCDEHQAHLSWYVWLHTCVLTWHL